LIKRLFDIVSSLAGITVLLVPGLIVALVISVGSRGGVFFKQRRVGLLGKPFELLKFRSMRQDAEQSGQLTVGDRDARITKIGYVLRKTKFDEFPQLINVLKGEMSIVGPRPEVPKYVKLYTDEQKKVLRVRPGLTDYASLEYFKESELLAQSDDPERTYINEIMPAKLALNQRYITEKSLSTDLKLISRLSDV
jgi:lipopolysaccharide/colanic/teichoic acid biosynthesis glycosyltransferase